MLTLYRKPNCPRCASIQEALEQLAIKHKVVEVSDAAELPGELTEGRLPALVDEDGTFQGAGAIADHLQELDEFKKLWYKYQSDACYCDDDGEIA